MDTTRPGSGGCCRMASAFPNPADAWATTWARILDLCADVNGAPFVRTPPRQSWGRGPSPQGWRRIQARRSTCLLLRTVQRRRAESLVLGAYHHRQYTVLLCWYLGTNIAVLLDCSKSSRQCSLSYLLTYDIASNNSRKLQQLGTQVTINVDTATTPQRLQHEAEAAARSGNLRAQVRVPGRAIHAIPLWDELRTWDPGD